MSVGPDVLQKITILAKLRWESQWNHQRLPIAINNTIKYRILISHIIKLPEMLSDLSKY